MLCDKEVMDEVLELAKIAYESSEVPVACIIVQKGKIISRTYNKKEESNLATAHAEILAIKEASNKLGRWRLNDCKIYVNLEPCLMCLGAIIEARFCELIFSVYDYNMGGINGRFGIGEEKIKLTSIRLKTGVLAKESKILLQSFFKTKRNQNSLKSC